MTAGHKKGKQMNKLYKRIMNRLADDLISKAYLEGYNLGLARGANSERNRLANKLENLEIEKFNNTGVTLGYYTALELVKED
jgi:hypothetical protein